jgi:hypothetical protein
MAAGEKFKAIFRASGRGTGKFLNRGRVKILKRGALGAILDWGDKVGHC